MKKYEKPELIVTSYEASDNIALTLSTGIQDIEKIAKINFNDITF